MPRAPGTIVVALLAACRGGEPPAPAPSAAPSLVEATPPPAPADAGPPADRRIRCERLDFAPTVDLAEASDALYQPAGAGLPAHLLVVSDSGNAGAFAVLDAATGAELGRGAFPLDPGATDDVEGFARLGDEFVALTSSGHARHFRRTGPAAFEATIASYPIGDAPGEVCPPAMTNCERNYEGLCLRAPPPIDGRCAGFAASKRDGALHCLVVERGRLRLDPARALVVAGREALTGCAFDEDGALWAGANLFGKAEVVRVRGPDVGADAERTSAGPLGTGFPEGIAAGPDGAIYRFSDLSSRPSQMDRFRCR